MLPALIAINEQNRIFEFLFWKAICKKLKYFFNVMFLHVYTYFNPL